MKKIIFLKNLLALLIISLLFKCTTAYAIVAKDGTDGPSKIAVYINNLKDIGLLLVGFIVLLIIGYILLKNKTKK